VTRWQLYPERIDEVNGSELLGKIGDEIVVDAKRLAPVRTGTLRDSIHVDEVTEKHVIVSANPRNPDPDTDPEDKAYAGFVEYGTSDTPRSPFLAPATYKYRG
jgi:HK97 gp10 family phage protein